VSNWRDGASEQVQDDFDRLAEVTVAAAREFLDRTGDFIPFPMVIKADGELALIGLEQHVPPSPPDPQEVIAGIVGLFRDRRDSIRALAVGSDVQVPAEAMDAIEVRLEHRDGTCLTILVPYQIDPLDDSYLFEEPRELAAAPRIWTS
jgi:hypothetical protein